MKTIFSSKQIKGKGRGKLLGYPTINLRIPKPFNYDDGIYAVWVTIGGKEYQGALHYGPVPTYKEKQKSLEVFLLDATEHELGDLTKTSIQVELVAWLRGVMSFKTSEALVSQIAQDVALVRQLLHACGCGGGACGGGGGCCGGAGGCGGCPPAGEAG